MNRREFISVFTAFAATATPLRISAANLPEVPSYYDAYLAEVIAKINRNRMERGCDEGFFFITDPHVKRNHRQTGRLIARIARKTGLQRVLCGGDLCEAFSEGYPTDKAAVDFAIDGFREDWVNPIRAAGGKLYCAKGNHDFTVRHSMRPEDKQSGFTYSGVVASKFLVDEWTAKDIVTNTMDPTACYYYVDVPSAKIRYVVADTTDSETSGDVAWGVKCGMHTTQMKWLASEALATVPEGYAVIMMQHIPVIDVAGTAEDHHTFSSLRQMLEAYQNRAVFRVADFTCDFTNARGWIAVHMSGHHHGESQTWANGILHVSEPCDAAYRDYDYRSAFCGTLPIKKAGTIYEQTFDVVQLDVRGRRLFLTRVGGGQDRVIHIDPIRVASGHRVRLEPETIPDVADWVSYDGDTAKRKPNPENRWNPLWEYKHDFGSVTSEGIFTASARKGVSIVMARNARLAKEIFFVQSV